MKKYYIKPEVDVIALEGSLAILAGSLSTYDVEAVEHLSNERSGAWDASEWE